MADTEREYPIGFVDKRRTQASNSSGLGTSGNYADVNAMRTRLAAALPTYYTASRLNNLTKNDMVYALRQIDDQTGI